MEYMRMFFFASCCPFHARGFFSIVYINNQEGDENDGSRRSTRQENVYTDGGHSLLAFHSHA